MDSTNDAAQAEAQRALLVRDLMNTLRCSRGGQPSRRGSIVRGAYCGRILLRTRTVTNGVVRELHATKGWRERRVAPGSA